MSSIERKCDGIKVDISDGNIKGFQFGTSDYELLGSFYNNIFGVNYYSKVVGELGCKESMSLIVYNWDVEVITEGNMIGFIIDSTELVSLCIFESESERLKERSLFGL